MPMDPGEIERMIKEALPDADVKLEDLVGDGDHWSATVISSAFTGKTRVQQHQLEGMRGPAHKIQNSAKKKTKIAMICEARI